MVLTELKVVPSHTCTCGQATISFQEIRKYLGKLWPLRSYCRVAEIRNLFWTAGTAVIWVVTRAGHKKTIANRWRPWDFTYLICWWWMYPPGPIYALDSVPSVHPQLLSHSYRQQLYLCTVNNRDKLVAVITSNFTINNNGLLLPKEALSPLCRFHIWKPEAVLLFSIYAKHHAPELGFGSFPGCHLWQCTKPWEQG